MREIISGLAIPAESRLHSTKVFFLSGWSVLGRIELQEIWRGRTVCPNLGALQTMKRIGKVRLGWHLYKLRTVFV
jgi:hypothetical protein